MTIAQKNLTAEEVIISTPSVNLDFYLNVYLTPNENALTEGIAKFNKIALFSERLLNGFTGNLLVYAGGGLGPSSIMGETKIKQGKLIVCSLIDQQLQDDVLINESPIERQFSGGGLSYSESMQVFNDPASMVYQFIKVQLNATAFIPYLESLLRDQGLSGILIDPQDYVLVKDYNTLYLPDGSQFGIDNETANTAESIDLLATELNLLNLLETKIIKVTIDGVEYNANVAEETRIFVTEIFNKIGNVISLTGYVYFTELERTSDSVIVPFNRQYYITEGTFDLVAKILIITSSVPESISSFNDGFIVSEVNWQTTIDNTANILINTNINDSQDLIISTNTTDIFTNLTTNDNQQIEINLIAQRTSASNATVITDGAGGVTVPINVSRVIIQDPLKQTTDPAGLSYDVSTGIYTQTNNATFITSIGQEVLRDINGTLIIELFLERRIEGEIGWTDVDSFSGLDALTFDFINQDRSGYLTKTLSNKTTQINETTINFIEYRVSFTNDLSFKTNNGTHILSTANVSGGSSTGGVEKQYVDDKDAILQTEIDDHNQMFSMNNWVADSKFGFDGASYPTVYSLNGNAGLTVFNTTIDVYNHKIGNVETATQDDEAVNLGQLNVVTDAFNPTDKDQGSGSFAFGSTGSPTIKNSGGTGGFSVNTLNVQFSAEINMVNRKIINLGNGTLDSNAVNLGQMNTAIGEVALGSPVTLFNGEEDTSATLSESLENFYKITIIVKNTLQINYSITVFPQINSQIFVIYDLDGHYEFVSTTELDVINGGGKILTVVGEGRIV